MAKKSPFALILGVLHNILGILMLNLSIFVCTNFSEAEIYVCANSYAFRMSASKSCDEQMALEVNLNFEIKMSNLMLQLLMQPSVP